MNPIRPELLTAKGMTMSNAIIRALYILLSRLGRR
jgi:hypothetical protein